MSRRMRTHATILNTLAHCSAKQRKALLKTADKGLIDAICECCVNLIRGNIKLSTVQKRSLSKHKHKLRTLSNRQTPLKVRKRILNQRGGFILPLLMKLAVPAIGALANVFTKK